MGCPDVSREREAEVDHAPSGYALWPGFAYHGVGGFRRPGRVLSLGCVGVPRVLNVVICHEQAGTVAVPG